MGTSSISGDETIIFADNASFDGTERGGKMTTDGQLWIGATASPHVRLGSLTGGTGITVTNGAGTITLSANGSVVGQTITGDSGGALSPTGGNWDILGQQAGSIAVMDTVGTAPSTLRIENLTWTTPFIVDPSATVGLRGTYQTIQAAVTAASSGQTVFVRAGTYTENVTLKSGVNICAYECDSTTPNVSIVGKLTMTTAGTVTISGIRLTTNSDFILAVTGSAASIVYLKNCYLNATNNTAISHTSSGAGTKIYIYDCYGDLGTTGITYFVSTANGGIVFNNSILTNTGNSTTASTTTTGSLGFTYTEFNAALSTSNAASVQAYKSVFSSSATAITMAGTGIGIYDNCYLGSATASVASAGAGTTINLNDCIINSSNANTITGAGTVGYVNLSFTGTSSGVNTTTQIPAPFCAGVVKVRTPGAYPYTAIPSDYVILVDTSSARTINLNASPVTGQTYRIKDNVGSAAANNITVTPAAGNIDGSASTTINVAYGSIDVCYNGTQWNIL